MEEASSAPDNLLLRIRALLPSLHEQEQKVGQYILSSPEEVVRLAIEDLAERCHASDTTIFRFCRKVGAAGYQDLKIRLAQDMAAARAPTYAVISDADTLSGIAAKAIQANVKALEDTLAVLDLPAVDRAAKVLLGARRVDIYGAGGGAIAALDLQYKLMRLGVRAVPHTDAEMQVVSATLLTAGGCGGSHLALRRVPRRGTGAGRGRQGGGADHRHHESPRIAAGDGSPDQPAHRSAGVPGVRVSAGARVAQVGLIDVLYSYMALMRRAEVDQNHARIAAALQKRQG